MFDTSVASITKNLGKMVDKLEAHYDSMVGKINENNRKIEELKAKSNEHEVEMNKAHRVKTKIKELIE